MERDNTDKLDWQAQEKTPAVPDFVRRFAAALRRALVQIGDWNQVIDQKAPGGKAEKIAQKIVNKSLDFSGMNATGQPIPFEKTFGDAMKTGALMAACVAATWKNGRPSIEIVDPRDVLLDPTGRGLYRVRRIEMDWHDLMAMAEQTDANGDPIWDKEAIAQAQANTDEEQRTNKRDSSGAGQETSSDRKTVVLHEFLSVNLDRDGEADASGERMLTVMLNKKTIIRGPEPNPFWHGKDWIVFHPLISAPLAAVDGETYVEGFIDTAETFENMTNILLDAVRMSSMNAFEANPEKLDDPDSLQNGLGPNHTFMLDPDEDDGKPAIRPVELGKQLGPEPFTMWNGLKGELREAAAQNDLSLGQVPQSGDVTATAATLASQGQSALTEAIAADIETGFLGPILLLAYYNTVQHMDSTSDPEFLSQFTPEELAMIEAQRDDFRNQRFSFKASGITATLERAQRLRGLLSALNVIGSNPMLVQGYQALGFSIGQMVKLVLEEHGVETDKLKATPEEQAQAAIAAQGQPSLGEGLSNGNSAGGVDPAAQNAGIEGGL